jgi:hypothetical protein
LLAAATGARFSQLAKLVVIDFQFENSRLMMPSSRKGKNRQPGARTAVPVGIDVMRRMLPIIEGRREDDTPSFIALIATAKDWTPKNRGQQARASRLASCTLGLLSLTHTGSLNPKDISFRALDVFQESNLDGYTPVLRRRELQCSDGSSSG